MALNEIYFARTELNLMHQSIPAVPIPPPNLGNCGASAHVASPGGGAFAILSRPRGLGISIPRGDPRAFDTYVFERDISLSEGRGLCQRLAYQGLEQLVDVFEGMFSQF